MSSLDGLSSEWRVLLDWPVEGLGVDMSLGEDAAVGRAGRRASRSFSSAVEGFDGLLRRR